MGLKGFDNFIGQINALKTKINKQAVKSMKKNIKIVEDGAKARCPVDTSYLRDESIKSSSTIELNKIVGEVGSNAEYAP